MKSPIGSVHVKCLVLSQVFYYLNLISILLSVLLLFLKFSNIYIQNFNFSKSSEVIPGHDWHVFIKGFSSFCHQQ